MFVTSNINISNMKKLLAFLALLIFSTSFAGTAKANGTAKEKPQLVIFETDMGNDIDDALALDLLYKYMDQGKIKLLAIMTNKEGASSAHFIDIMNTWYGYPKIPIGIVRNGAECKHPNDYTLAVSDMKANGKPAFKTSVKDVTKLPDAEQLYRKILSKQPDHSVVIISVGFSTNLARLLDTRPDSYSSLNGRELIKKKVKLFSLMAGNFDQRHLTEYNVVKDIAACAKLFKESPIPIVTSPFELGEAVQYPGKSIENDFGWTTRHPMVEAYKAYAKMPYDRPTWDLTAVLEVLEPGKFMTQSPKGTIVVDEKGHTDFTQEANGLHSYLTITPEQGRRIKQFFVETIPQKAKRVKD